MSIYIKFIEFLGETKKQFQGGLLLIAIALFAGCATTNSSDAINRVRFEDTPEGARAILDESIIFDVGSSEFKGSAYKVLEVLQPVFSKARKAFTIEGHTDSTGSVAFNQKLSIQRAERVRDAVIRRQIPPDKVIAKGYGSSKPRRVPELSADDRQLNRRAEFLFPGETVESLNARSVEKQLEDIVAGFVNDTAKAVGNALDMVVGKESANSIKTNAGSSSPSLDDTKSVATPSKNTKRKVNQ